MTTDREHAAVLRRMASNALDSPELTDGEWAAIQRAIELLEKDIEWIDGIPLVLIAKKKKAKR